MTRSMPLVAIACVLLVAAGLAGAFGPRGDADESPSVDIEVLPPRRAILREPSQLEVRIVNRGPAPIADLGVKINRGYANVMTVIETRPRAMIDDASTEKRLYFGPLGAGQSGVYRVTMIPQRSGTFSVLVRIVAIRRGLDPLVLRDQTSGRVEFSGLTEVLDERAPTPTVTPR